MKLTSRAVCLLIASACLAAPGAAEGKAYVVCYNYAASDIGYVSKPNSCAFLVAGSDPISANIVDTLSLRWRNWGKRTTTASGIQAGNGGYRVKAKIILTARERCGRTASDFIYRRVRITVKGRTKFAFRLTGCSQH